MSINHSHSSMLPREKFLLQGAEALSDEELLALFLRTGVQGKGVVALASELLGEFGSLHNLLSASCSELTKLKGVGTAKYIQLAAILELSKRYLAEGMNRTNLLDSPNAVRKYLHQILRPEPYELFVLVHLDNQHRVINDEVLFRGSIDSAAVYPRVVVDTVLSHKSSAVIFAHNHPSGVSEPSQADIALTERLKQALQLIDVRTLDHFIVGGNEIISFAERGLL